MARKNKWIVNRVNLCSLVCKYSIVYTPYSANKYETCTPVFIQIATVESRDPRDRIMHWTCSFLHIISYCRAKLLLETTTYRVLYEIAMFYSNFSKPSGRTAFSGCLPLLHG